MDTPAWWSAYFGGELDAVVAFEITKTTSIGVIAKGTERRPFVVCDGERMEFVDRQPVMSWRQLVDLAHATPRRDHAFAILQRFTWISVTEVPAVNKALREAHRGIGVVGDVDAFVDRTLVTNRASPPHALIASAVHAARYSTPRLAYDTEWDLGADRLREARALPEKLPARAVKYRESVQHFFSASEQPVDARERAAALAYSGAMLVELSHELPDEEALVTLELAASRLELVTRIDPNNFEGKRRAADAYHHMADRLCDNEPERAARIYAQACQHANELLEKTPPEEHAATLDVLCGVECMLEDCLRRSGRPVEGKAALDRAIVAADKIAEPTMNRACAYAAAGRLEEAMTILELAAVENELPAEGLRTNDVFDPLHADPRWDALLAKLA